MLSVASLRVAAECPERCRPLRWAASLGLLGMGKLSGCGSPSPWGRFSYAQKLQIEEQHLTTPQETDRLQSQLKEAETKLKERDTEIEALKVQVERMKADWVEEECHRVETELALLDARKEIENLREVNESLNTSLAQKEKEFQKFLTDVCMERKKLESLLQSMEEMPEGCLYLSEVTSNGSDTVQENSSPAASEWSEPVSSSSEECEEMLEGVLDENLRSSQEQKKIIEMMAQLQIEEEGKHEAVELAILEATKETTEPQPEEITESTGTSPGLHGQNNGSLYGEPKASPPASPDSDPLTTRAENQRSFAIICQDDTAASASSSLSGSDQGSDSSPELRRLGRSVLYGRNPQNKEQDLTTVQEKDLLQSQLKEAETKIKERDTEIEALKAHVERAKEDWVEEECHHVETELAVLDARLEMTNFKGIIHSLTTSLAEEEKKLEECLAGQPSPQLRRLGRSVSCGQKPWKKLQHLTTPQEKDRALQRLQSQLKEAETKIKERDTEIEALKVQVERMKADWVEEECHHVETELAVLEASAAGCPRQWPGCLLLGTAPISVH